MERCISLRAGAVAVLVAGLAWPAPAAAQSEPIVRITARSVAWDGSSGSTASSPRRASEKATGYLTAGDIQRGSSYLCTLGAFNGESKTLAELVRDHPHVWTFTTTPGKRTRGAIVVNFEWARYSDGVSAQAARSGRQELHLLEGRAYVLDLVRADGDANGCHVGSVVVEVTAGVRDDPTLADELLLYDLWLVHTDQAGRKRSQHLVMSGLHGMELPFAFSPMRLPVPKLAPDQYGFEVATRVSGTFRGRLTSEGRIEMDVAVGRRHRLERTGTTSDTISDAGPAGNIGNGRKTLSLAPGETVAIQLPLSGGVSAARATPGSRGISGTSAGARQGSGASAGAPVTLNDGTLHVNFDSFFDGHDMSVLIRVRDAN
jgi:hypothetical protein